MTTMPEADHAIGHRQNGQRIW